MTWDIWVALSYTLIYASTAAVLGGVLVSYLWHKSAPADYRSDDAKVHQRYVRIGACLGVTSAMSSYFLFIGSINQAGIRGMFDADLFLFLLLDPPGIAAMTHIAAFLVIGFGMGREQHIWRLVLVLGYAGLLWGFTVRGHLASSPLWIQLALMLHVLALGAWTGALLPLWFAARRTALTSWKSVFETFGQWAQAIVGILILAGIFMTWALLSAPSDFVATDYGIALLLKLCFVAILLGCAGLNKWVIVPRLKDDSVSPYLAWVIYIEMLCVAVIFALTATFTVVVGHN